MGLTDISTQGKFSILDTFFRQQIHYLFNVCGNYFSSTFSYTPQLILMDYLMTFFSNYCERIILKSLNMNKMKQNPEEGNELKKVYLLNKKYNIYVTLEVFTGVVMWY